MLKGQNDRALIEKGINEQHIVFYQVWKELTEKKTFDTYQFKSMNIINGIQEVIENINHYLSGGSKSKLTLDISIQELQKIIKNDYVLRTDKVSVKNQLLSKLSKKPDTDYKLKALRSHLNFFLKEISSWYDKLLIDNICKCVGRNSIKEYIAMTSIFISRSCDLGWSVNALSRKVDQLTMDDSRSPEELLKAFLSKINNAKKQHYIVLVPFRLKVTPAAGKTKEETVAYVYTKFDIFNIKVKSNLTIKEDYYNIDITKLNDNNKYIEISVDAFDSYNASHIANEKLSTATSMLRFFSTIEPWSTNDSSFITFNTDYPKTEVHSASDIYGTYDYLEGSSIVYQKTEQLLKKSSNNNDFFQRLITSFSYANLSKLSISLEEKYINMWIALESITKTETNDSIIGSIMENIPNAVCQRYIYRIVRNFIEDCLRCEVSFSFSTRTIDVNDNDKIKLVKKVINIIRDDSLSNELKEKCSVNSLLYYRFEMIKKLLSNPDELVKAVKSHEQNVKRHLCRLYRIRNEIAHAGLKQDITVLRFIEHLYDYLSTFISEIVRCSNEKKINDLDEIMVYINSNYLAFSEITRTEKELLGKFWETGIMEFI